jgi:lipopolysaccharide transport system permease protein
MNIFNIIWQNRELIYQLTCRQISERYKGSFLGISWSFLTPLAMMLVYTFIFSVVIKIKWEGGLTGSHSEFAVTLLTGLVAFNIFSESILSSSDLILNNPNYVKKVVFPLETLPIIMICTNLLNSLISLLILLFGVLIVFGHIPFTIILLPFIYLPLVMMCLGLSWIISSLGIFFLDIKHFLTITVQLLFFLTPVFYPVTAIPEQYRSFLFINPMVFIVTLFRQVILWGEIPKLYDLMIIYSVSITIFFVGITWFTKIKKNFADVI